MKHRLLPAALLLACSPLVLSAPSAAQSSIPGYAALNEPCQKCCGYDCGDSCSNFPFQPSSCKTTPYGPARANIVIGANALQSTNMLYCPGGTTENPRPYALCFFSGPTSPTGAPGGTPPNQTLSCIPDLEKGIAKCQCQVYSTGAYYVDINSILNLGAFWETHWNCGVDGSLCKNIATCDENGKTKTGCGASPCPPCPDKIAPVCAYIAAQPSGKDLALYPQAYHSSASRVDLVSTFSFAMGTAQPGGAYQLGSTPCTNNGIYAGCMTAPCTYPEGGAKTDGSIVNCACPLWQGDYQIGQPAKDLPSSTVCPTNAGWVWSAANAVVPPSSSN